MAKPEIYVPEHLKLRQLRSEALRDGRKAAKYNKKEFSEKTRITRETIDKIESCRGSWMVDTEIIYLHALGMISFQPIFGEEEGKRVIVKMALIPAK